MNKALQEPLIQDIQLTVSARCNQMVNIISGLYFVKKELKTLGLETASNLIEGASLSLKEELNKIFKMRSSSNN